MILTFITLGNIMASQTLGFLSDTCGRRKVLIMAGIGAFVTAFLSSFSMSFVHLAMFRFVNGWFIAGSTGTIFAYLGEFVDAKSRSHSIMVASFVYGIGCISVPFIALFIINHEWILELPLITIAFKPWRLFIIICSIPSLICGIGSYYLPESPKFTYYCLKDEEKTMKILQLIQKTNKSSEELEFKLIPVFITVEDVEKLKKNVISQMFAETVELTTKHFRAFSIVSFIQFGSTFVSQGLLVFFPDILNQSANYIKSSDGNTLGITMCTIVHETIANKTMSPHESSCTVKFDIGVHWYIIILQTCYVVGFLIISIVLWKGLHRLYVLNFLFLTAGVAGILMIYLENITAASYSFIWLMTNGLMFSLVNTIAFELFPTHLRSLGISLVTMFGRLGERL